ncbi:glycosyltransferase family 2 protein [Massilia sp. W12]|uniref:glycosyltransferase family 2 protein n=1 Tax=Massilia sp. W12 TaxID=3126507 RepID=UPI0030D556FF
MAIIDIDFDISRAVIRFEDEIRPECLDSDTLLFEFINNDGVLSYAVIKYQYMDFGDENVVVPVLYPEKLLTMVMPRYGEAKVGFYVNGQLWQAEQIRFTARMLNLAMDPLSLNVARIQLPQKPGRVAVMTQTYNEGKMLKYWEEYYAAKVGYENLFVMNNHSTDGSCELLHPKTSVINMPEAPVQHDHFSQAQGYLQRFLLLKYDWVIKVDTDELLVCEGDLVQTLMNTAPGTYTPEQGVEVIHDTEKEAPFDWTGKVAPQRKHYVLGTEFLIRPIISTVPSTWTSGNHMCHELYKPLPGFYSVHLKYFDHDFLLSKNKKWSEMTQTQHETTTCRQITDLQELGLQGIFDLTLKEINDRLALPPLPLPAWFPSRF